MLIGGVMLGAGMELDLRPGDYRDGTSRIRFILHHIVGPSCDTTQWIVLDGYDQPGTATPWKARRVHVRIAALKRSLALL